MANDGHQHHAAAAGHLVDGRGQLLLGGLVVGVLAVAVRRFGQHVVGVGERRGVGHDRGVAASEVAGEDDRGGRLAVGHPQLDDRRAQDVPRVVEGGVHPGRHLGHLPVSDGSELADGLVHVALVVQRGAGSWSCPAAARCGSAPAAPRRRWAAAPRPLPTAGRRRRRLPGPDACAAIGLRPRPAAWPRRAGRSRPGRHVAAVLKIGP